MKKRLLGEEKNFEGTFTRIVTDSKHPTSRVHVDELE